MSVISEALAIWRIGDRKIWSRAQEEAISHSWTDNTSDPFGERECIWSPADLHAVSTRNISVYLKYSGAVPIAEDQLTNVPRAA